MRHPVKKQIISLALLVFSSLGLPACQSTPSLLPPTTAQINALPTGLNIFSFSNPNRRRPKLGLKLTSQTRRIKADNELETIRTTLPSRVDLRQFDSPIINQGDLGACTGFAIVKGLREFMLNRDRQAFQPLSPLFLYYNERKVEGSIDEDAGAMITTGMELLKNIGVAREALWSYDPANDNNPRTKEKFQQAPPAAAYHDARQYRVKEIKPLDSLRDIRYELAHKNPVVIGIEVYEEFYETQGHLPKPNPRKKSEGGHAVFVVGYDDREKVLIVKNSWGPEWGDRGYVYLPYDYVKLGLATEAFSAL